MRVTELHDREHALEGSVNFRDLGGLPTRDGAVVRRGRFFRSDALANLTGSDLDRLRAFGIASMIDLRTTDELERNGLSPLREHGVRHLHTPLIDRTGEPRGYDPEMRLGDFYVGMLERAGERIREIFSILAEPANLPSVVHCSAGKDRTGITVALVLRTLDVPDTAIVADYVMTDRNMARLIASWEQAGRPISQMEVPEHFMRAVPETMEYFLATVDDRWGSVHGYLDQIEVADRVREAVRANLLEQVSAER